MGIIKMNNGAGFRLVGLLAVVLLTACQQPDIKLVNKVKTFDPKWSTLNGKFIHLDRNLDIAEDHFEKDFSEIKGMLGEIPDSLRNRTYRTNVARYDSIIMDRDTIRAIYNRSRENYIEEMDRFNVWEKEVMNGAVDYESGKDTLIAFKASHQSIENRIDSVTVVLEKSFADHNAILRDLARRLGIFQNFDLKMK